MNLITASSYIFESFLIKITCFTPVRHIISPTNADLHAAMKIKSVLRVFYLPKIFLSSVSEIMSPYKYSFSKSRYLTLLKSIPWQLMCKHLGIRSSISVRLFLVAYIAKKLIFFFDEEIVSTIMLFSSSKLSYSGYHTLTYFS